MVEGVKPGIWMVSASFYPHIGGGEKQALLLSKTLAGKGWRVQILTRLHNPNNAYTPPRTEIFQQIPLHRVTSPGGGKLGSFLFVISGLLLLGMHGRGGIYHAHGIGAPATIAILAARLFRGKSIVKLRTGVEYYNAMLRSGNDRGLRFQLRHADRLIVLNEAVRDLVIHLGCSRDRVVLLPNAVDVDEFRPCPQKAQARADLLGAETGPIASNVFLYVGRLAPEKGVDVLLTAWAVVEPEIRENSRLVIVGDGPARSELMSQAESLGLGGSVSFMGSRPDVQAFYCAADAVILPSRREGLSNVMLESMASGVAVIGTAVGGALDWIKPDENGKLVPPEDPDAIAEAIRWLLDHQDRKAGLEQAARRLVEDEFSARRLSERLESLYLAISG